MRLWESGTWPSKTPTGSHGNSTWRRMNPLHFAVLLAVSSQSPRMQDADARALLPLEDDWGRTLADRRRARLPREDSMIASSPSPLLRPALTVFGLIFIFGIFILNRVWPSGWAWQPEQPAYLQMILGIYVTLGVFLLLAARDPIRHLSLIWFTVWSSIVHAVVMAVHSVTDPGQIGHLWGDVAALLLTAAVLAAVTPRQLSAPSPT